MEAIFTILLIGMALTGVVLVMFFVLREQPHDGAGTNYIRSPWRDEPVKQPTETTSGEAISEAAGTPAAHTPVIDADTEKTAE
jgi:hypothetical protein